MSDDAACMGWKGDERRRHRVYLTRNTEYHLREGVCVAVRDRRTGEWLAGHLAMRRTLHCGIRFYMNGAIRPNLGDPRVGEALFFTAGGRDLVTSPVEAIARPERHVVETYAA
jgi:hypothetical protein